MDLKSFFGIEKRSLNDYTPQTTMGLSLPFTGTDNYGYGATNLSAAYACINLIADAIGSLPILVKKKTSKGKTTIMKNHPVNLLFNDRKNRLSRFEFLKLITQSVIMRGNGFAYIERANDGTPLKLRYLESSDVTINYDKQRDILTYQSYVIGGKAIQPENMLHFVKNSYDGVNGISVLRVAKRTIDIASATENQSENFFKTGCNLSGIVKVTSPLNAKQRQDILSTWATTYSGGKSGVAVLQGNMDYQPISLNAEDAQMLESRKYNVEDICRFFQVNPILVGLEGHSSYSSLEMLQEDFLVHTLQPYLIMIENELDRKLLTDDESNLKIVLDTNAVLRTEKEKQADYYTKLVQAGIMTVNEVRTELGYSLVDGGDDLIVAYSKIQDNQITNNNSDEKENNEIKEDNDESKGV